MPDHPDALRAACAVVEERIRTEPAYAHTSHPEGRPYGYLVWIDPAGPLAGGWAGQHVHAVPAADAVVVTTGDPGFDPGPPPTDRLAPGWRPAHDLVAEHLLPVLAPPVVDHHADN